MSDPAVSTWHESMGLSTSAILRQTQDELAAVREELARTQAALAASQADLTRAEAELLADVLDSTARQVRLDDITCHKDRTVHEVVRAWTDRQVGRTYRTRCQYVMTQLEGAILTTRETTCGRCLRGGR